MIMDGANTFESVSFDPALDLPSLEQPHRLEKPYTLSPRYIYASKCSVLSGQMLPISLESKHFL